MATEDHQWISKRLEQLGFNDSVLSCYDESWRYYHTREHLHDVLGYLQKKKFLNDELFLAAVYHDSVYDPKSNDNEARSAKRFEKDATSAGLKKSSIEKISQYILDTKDHKATSPESQKLIDADLQILDQSLSSLMEHEHKIYKEFQFMSHSEYRKERVQILNET